MKEHFSLLNRFPTNRPVLYVDLSSKGFIKFNWHWFVAYTAVFEILPARL